jgi:hypothetical protein
MSHHTVVVVYQRDTITYEEVVDINYFQSSLVELTFKNGSSKLIRDFTEIDVSAPLDDSGNPLETLRD